MSVEDPRRPLRVAQFTDNYGPGCNGLTVAVQALEGNLLDAGHEVIVVAPAAKGVNPHKGRPGRTELRLPSLWFPGVPTRVATGRHFERTIKKLAELKPDVAHVHGFGAIGALGTIAARRLGIPLLTTWHTDFEAYADYYSQWLPLVDGVLKAFVRLSKGALVDKDEMREAEIKFEDRGYGASLIGMCAKMLELSQLVTTPSPKTAEHCLQIAPDATVRVVPNGVNPLPVGPPPFERPRGPLVMYAGRIAPEKGIVLLTEAFELVANHRPDARLMVVGDWDHHPPIRRALQNGRDKGIIILPGEQKRDDLGAFYAMADVFVFPSQTDTQALVLHEAALAGLPLVSVDSELTLVIDPPVNGAITRPTPVSLAAGILRVIDQLDDNAWREQAARRSVELASQWTIESQAEEMLGIYRDLAG
ncbi:MAG TPA: glycosyltransferase [Arachnia sp.]|nr:glycosyltransferase [Arachnia sp.]HMT84838.1 glycosyltransferase [Arachnia sp.]